MTQREKTEAEIERELEEFDERRQKWRDENGVVEEDGSATGQVNGSEAHEQEVLRNGREGRGNDDQGLGAEVSNGALYEESNGSGSNGAADSGEKHAVPGVKEADHGGETQEQEQAHGEDEQKERRISLDEGGDVMVDAGEDTVIY